MAGAPAHARDDAACFDEARRLAALRAYGILDTAAEAAFDDIAKLAAQVCAAPIALVSFVESGRQWFKAEVGLGRREMPISQSICAHALHEDGLFVVPDTTHDPRFAANSSITGEPHLRFYAGAPLETTDGLRLGTLCVLDHKPRPEGLPPAQAGALLALARQVMSQLEQQRLLQSLAEREAQLAESEQRFRTIADSVDQMIWLTQPDGFHDFYNRRWYEFTGVPEGSTEGEGWNGMFHPDDQERAWATWRHALASGETYHIEYRLRHRSGQYRWVLGRAQPERDKLGRIKRWYGTCTDIHDLKLAQQNLAKSEARYRTLLDVSPQVVWFGDAAGAITYCNAYWYAYTGLEPGDTSGDGWASVIHPDHREHVLGVWKEAVRTCSSYEVEVPFRRASDGSYRWFVSRGLPVRSATGEITGWTGIALDIHERKQAEEATARLAAIVSSSPDAVVSFDPDSGRIQTWNRGAEALFGYSGAEAIGAPVSLLVPSEGLTSSEDETGVFRLARTHGKAEIESVRRCKDGRLLDVSVTASRVTVADGRVLGVAAIFRDISDRKRAERALADERARLKAVFETVPVGIVIADAATGQITAGNPQVEHIMRHPVLPSADITAYRDWVAFHPDGRRVEGHEYPLARAISTGEISHGDEYLYQRGDGSSGWIRIAGAPIRDEAGQITGGVVAIVDIDGEKQAEAAIRQSEARLRRLIEASPIGVAIGDLEGGYAYGNPTLQKLLGYSAEEFARGEVSWRQMTPPEWLERNREAVRQLNATGITEAHEKEYVAKDGRRVPVLIAAALLEAEGERRQELAAYVVDLTAAKQAEAALRDREALLGSIFQSAGLCTGVLDLFDDDVQFVMANAYNAALYGRTPAEMENARLSEIGLSREEADGWLTFLRECYAKAEATTLEFPFSVQGSTVYFLGTFTPLPSGAEGRPRLSVVALDITERKRLEEQQALITRELHHRVKNTLATVQAVVSSTARHARTMTEFQLSITDRIASLAKTHTLLINDAWGGADLRAILLAELSPYDDGTDRRVRLDGPDVHLPSEIALALSMAAHELTTNAAKYGAFSLPTGRVEIKWGLDERDSKEPRLTLTWVEEDGPLVETPSRKGFGSVLLQRVLGRQLGGEVETTYAPEGLRVRVSALLRQN